MVASPTDASSAPPNDRRWLGFSAYAWLLLGYTLFVILFGAWVRITGSGAGCGDHWPTCHGELIPRSPRVQTIIEYTHRLTSGVLGPAVVALVVWAFYGAGRRRVVRTCASLTLLLVVVEALIGAGLVLRELVADDDSVARAIVVALHLGNTLMLTGAGALTAWFGAGRRWPGFQKPFAWRTPLLVGLAGVLLTSMTGAVTALGDTLFPVPPAVDGSLFAHVQGDLSAGMHFLVRLRVVHPVVAVIAAAFLLWLAGRSWVGAGSRRWARTLSALVWAQVLAGSLNVALRAPGWLQLSHLLLAQLVWIAAVLLYFAAAEEAGDSDAGARRY